METLADTTDDAAVPLESLVSVGLKHGKHRLKLPKVPRSSAGTRVGLVLLGGCLLAVGASPRLYASCAAVLRKIKWRRVWKRVVHVADCSRWIFTVINITNETYKKW